MAWLPRAMTAPVVLLNLVLLVLLMQRLAPYAAKSDELAAKRTPKWEAWLRSELAGTPLLKRGAHTDAHARLVAADDKVFAARAIKASRAAASIEDAIG
jgi:hypothetical protein